MADFTDYFNENGEDPTASASMLKTAGGGSDPYLEAVSEVRNKLSQVYSSQELETAGSKVEEDAKAFAREVFRTYNTRADNQGFLTIDMSREEFVTKVTSELLGMGELTPLLEDLSIEDIAINGPNEVYVFRGGKWELQAGLKFSSSERLLEMINRGISAGNKKANMVIPIADGVLPGKERVSVVTFPVTDNWPTIVIRAHRSREIHLADFTKKREVSADEEEKFSKTSYLVNYAKTDTGGMLSAKAATYLHAAVLAGLNIVVIGPTGVGKTTLLTALGKCIPEGERVLIIEDTPEINLNPGSETPKNIVYLRTRAAGIDGKLDAVEQADLVKLALRQRPDALTLGEARGKEVFDLLNALNTGHKNGLTSLHAEGPHEVFGRIFMMLAQSDQGRHLDRFRAANLAASTMNILVTLQIHGSRRSVQSIVEYSGKLVNVETSPEPEIIPIFENTGGKGNLGPMLMDSCFAAKFQNAGMPSYSFTTEPLPDGSEFCLEDGG